MKTALAIIFWLDILGLNLAVGYFIYKNWMTEPISLLANQSINRSNDSCGSECRDYIDQVIATRILPTKSLTPTITTSPTPTSKATQTPTPIAKTNLVRRVSYITILGNGGSNSGQEWIDVANSEFYLDMKDYPGFVEAYFESNMELVNGSGMAYVRIYDVTHGIGVQGSDVQTNNNSATIVTSGKLSFWQGNNLYRIQVRSLTAEVAKFLSGRIRIVTAN